MDDGIQVETSLIKAEAGHGGRREGAGRPKGVVHQDKWMRARGINPLLAGEILDRATDEMKTWRRLLSSQDDRVVLDAMKFLMMMRDGKPAQSVTVKSTSIQLTGKDIDKARAIIGEIRATLQPALLPSYTSPSLGKDNDARPTGEPNPDEQKANASIMLPEVEGEKIEGGG